MARSDSSHEFIELLSCIFIHFIITLKHRVFKFVAKVKFLRQLLFYFLFSVRLFIFTHYDLASFKL